jgi:DNA-binding MarR family transcriptional regulator/GNAT superfamily N-acetyltransferase
MIDDIVAAEGYLFLGTRLKRLGERMQADVTRMIEAAGLDAQPAQYPLLAALSRHGSLTVGELVQATGISQPGVTRTLARLSTDGLIVDAPVTADRRVRAVRLSKAGKTLIARTGRDLWPDIRAAAEGLCAGTSLLADIARVEASLARSPLDQRAKNRHGLRIRKFEAALAPVFAEIGREWITASYTLEDTDRAVLDDPVGTIIAPGGDVLFIEAEGLGVVGTVALRRTAEGEFELTKMGVRESARGMRAGEKLMQAAIQRARELGARELYLLTNKKAVAAIRLYEKSGFEHSQTVMRDHGAAYARADVAMRYTGSLQVGEAVLF